MNGNARFAFVLEYVNDIEAAKRFYTEVMGLKVERDSPTFVQFDHFAIGADESMSGTREPEVYYAIEDAESTLAELSKSAQIDMPLREMPFGKVFSIKDPSGNPLYIIEFAKVRPSQTAG